jgi:hypothetical protein
MTRRMIGAISRLRRPPEPEGRGRLARIQDTIDRNVG